MFILKKSFYSSAPIKRYSPYTIEEIIADEKKKNKKVRAIYYSLANRHKHQQKLHIIFTSPQDENRFDKLEHIILIRNRFNKLLKNLKLDPHFFSNIELGENYDNPHLDIQLWIDKSEINKITNVYQKTLKACGLNGDFCRFNIDSEVEENRVFHYTVKEYSRSLTDIKLFELCQARKEYRRQLSKNVRFYSYSRNKYSQKIYRLMYRTLELTYQETEYVLDNKIIEIKENSELALNIEVVRKLKRRHLDYIYNKLNYAYRFIVNYKGNFICLTHVFCYWVYGFT